MTGVLDYSKGNSIFHNMNPVTKIIIALCICVAAFGADNLLFLVGIVALDLIIGIISGIKEKAFSIFKGFVKISVFLFVLQVLFVRSGNAVFLFITDEGIILAAKIVLRLMGAALPLTYMLTVTKVSDLSNALVKVCHVPYKYAFTITTAVRFIPVFINELDAIIEAQTARGVEFDTKNAFARLKLILPLCVPLLMTSVKKADSSAVSAELRGFYLRKQSSGYKEYPFKAADILAIILFIAFAVFGILM